MSPSDISRIQSIASGRPVGREQASAPSPLPTGETANAASSAPSVKVETSAALDASQPPVDASRVADIRKALEQGTYPLTPTKIADAMIAAPLLLSVGR